jgi:hypothetical protein
MKKIDEASINEYIEFLSHSASYSRKNKILLNKSFSSEFLEKVKHVIDGSKSKIDENKNKQNNIQYE